MPVSGEICGLAFASYEARGSKLTKNQTDRRPQLRVWALSGSRAGDRAQVLALAEALGWPFEEKRLRFNYWRTLPNVLLGPSRLSLDREQSDALGPPWPDLVIASGGRSAPVARWIRRRAPRDCRLVHVGRPWAPLKHFDLVVTTPQYGLPSRSNVLTNFLTLNRFSPASLSEAAALWAPRFAALPHPRIGIVVGGEARPYLLDRDTARDLGLLVDRLAKEQGGSLLVTTSRRTGAQAAESLFAAVTRPAFVHRWSDSGDNPYLGLLAVADFLVVTGDSASMLSEACATLKPVYIFKLPERPDLRMTVARFMRGSGSRMGFRTVVYDKLVDLGLLTSTRDMAAFHAALIERGMAAELGGPVPAGASVGADPLEATAGRVRKLFLLE